MFTCCRTAVGFLESSDGRRNDHYLVRPKHGRDRLALSRFAILGIVPTEHPLRKESKDGELWQGQTC
jgi:hypothetical protein